MVLVCSAAIDYTSTSVLTSAWTQLSLTDQSGSTLSPNALPTDINAVQVDDSSGELMQLGIGAALAQVQVLQIPPNCSQIIHLLMNSGQSVWIRAVSANAVSGRFSINFLRGRRG